MSFTDAILQAMGVIAIMFLFGSSLVAQQIRINHLPLRPSRPGRVSGRGRGAGGLRARTPEPCGDQPAGDDFARFCPVARDGGGEGGFVIPALPEAHAGAIDWDAFHDAGDRLRMAPRASDSSFRPAVGEDCRRGVGLCVCVPPGFSGFAGGVVETGAFHDVGDRLRMAGGSSGKFGEISSLISVLSRAQQAQAFQEFPAGAEGLRAVPGTTGEGPGQEASPC